MRTCVYVFGGRAILLIDSIYLWRPVGPTLPISVIVKDPADKIHGVFMRAAIIFRYSSDRVMD